MGHADHRGGPQIDYRDSFFFKYILLIMLLQLSHSFFPPLSPSASYPHSLQHSPLLVHVRKFFGFSISYTILTLPLSILYLPIMLLNPCTPRFFPFPLPTDNPPCDLHFCDSVPVLVICLVCFCFRFSC